MSGQVLVATLGPRMPAHRILLAKKTCCGQDVSSTWQTFMAPLESVECPVCKVAASVLREGRAEEPATPAGGAEGKVSKKFVST